MEDILYLNKENEEVSPEVQSLLDSGGRKTLGKLLHPPTQNEYPLLRWRGVCTAPRSCSLHESGALQTVNHVVSGYDGQKHKIFKNLNCSTQNVIYYILCSCGNTTEYVGSTKDMKTGRLVDSPLILGSSTGGTKRRP